MRVGTSTTPVAESRVCVRGRVTGIDADADIEGSPRDVDGIDVEGMP